MADPPRYIGVRQLMACLAALGWRLTSSDLGHGTLVAFAKPDASDVTRVLVLPLREGYPLWFLDQRLSAHQGITLQDVLEEYDRQFDGPPPYVPM